MKYIYQNYLTPELEEALNRDSELHKLVKELNFSFDLYAYNLVDNEDSNKVKIAMCNKYGFHVSNVHVGSGTDNDGHNTPLYCYFSTYYSKSRGSSDRDRRTLTSIKLSSLIATMKRNKVVPDADSVVKEMFIRVIDSARGNISAAVGKGHRDYKSSGDVDTEVYHAMLKILLGNGSQDLLMQFDRTKLQDTLARFNNIDRIKAEREQAVKEKLVLNEFYGIGVTNYGDYLVTRFNILIERQGNSMYLRPNFKENMVRVKSINESHGQFIPLLTMLKVAIEGKDYPYVENKDGWQIPKKDYYDEGLEINFIEEARDYRRDFIQWMFIPCSAI